MVEMSIKAVVTGGTGYVGSNLLRYLLSKGWDLYVIAQPEFGYANIEDIKDRLHIIEYDNDIKTLITFFKETNPDVVFHLAAAVLTNYKPEQVAILIQSNIQFGTEVLESMKESKTRLFINTGSYWQNYNSVDYNPVDLYAATKEAFEKIIHYYVDAFQFRAITLRLFDIYGEDDKRPKLLNLLRNMGEDGTELNVSPGEQLLDMVHILDVCAAYFNAYELMKYDTKLKYEIYGISSENSIPLKELIRLFEQILNKKINVNLGARPYKTREVMEPCRTYKRLPNWKPLISLEDGLKRFR